MRTRLALPLLAGLILVPAVGAADPPKSRLPRAFLPESNHVQISLDPSQETFQGQIEIRGQLQAPTRVIWLNAEALELDRATLTRGGKSTTLRVLPQPKDFVGLEAPRELPPGPATLVIKYRGRIDPKETEGIFRQKVADAWYAFTQLEAVSARRAFPCFDEPDSKVPWTITLEVPRGMVALANTPEESETPTKKGTTLVRFAATPPLPSYLIAFAVGPFEVVAAGKTRGGAPLRVIVPKGHGGEVDFVVKTTFELLALLEDYFGSPYPFAKLDLLAIPQTVNFGAMENPGLVTFNQRLLTARRQDFTIGFQRSSAGTIAHELAHQWFGDLVTLAWWDDTWLNEAFASWMGDKVVDAWRPDWSHGTGPAESRDYAIAIDDLASTRKIRQPVVTNDDIEDSFNGIVYVKGQAVLSAFEHWVGEEAFQKGVRAYLTAHAGKNATSANFLAALDAAAGKPVSSALATFLDQVGAPLVRVGLVCDKGKPPRVTLAQERFAVSGSRVERKQTWQLPVCVRYPEGRACTLLAEPRGELVLDGAKTCPRWIAPNEAGLGYYRASLQGDLLARLLDRGMNALTLAERVALIDDVDALVKAGEVDLAIAGRLVTGFAGDENLQIVRSVVGIAAGMKWVAEGALQQNYGRFIARTFGARARQLGWKPGADESEDQKLLRKSLVPIVAVDGGDVELVKEATRLALAWLDDHEAVDPDLVSEVLGTAARKGDRALYERFLAAARTAPDLRDRGRLLRALAAFRDPELVRQNIRLVVDKAFDPREAYGLLYGGAYDERTKRVAYEEIKKQYDALAAVLPAPSRAYLVNIGASQCDRALREDVRAFFEPRTPKEMSGQTAFTQAMEALDLCIENRAARRASVEKFLRAY